MYSLLLVWSTIYAYAAKLPIYERICHTLLAVWSVLRTIWPWIPVTTDAGHLFYKWIDNIGGDMFLTYLMTINVVLIALALRKKLVVFKGIRGWYKGALIAAASILFILEILTTFLVHFMYLETMMMVYLIYYLAAMGVIAAFSFVSGGIIVHSLRSQAKELGGRSGRKITKIVIHMFIISITCLVVLPMLGYIMTPNAEGFFPDMLCDGYLTYIGVVRCLEFIAGLSFITRRGKKFLDPFMLRKESSEMTMSSVKGIDV
jgi:hypothetical protein